MGRNLDTAFLTDFGLAKTVGTGSRYTRTGQTLGTPGFLSPEQARGDLASLGPATDVWSLGCVLHAMLTGQIPFAGESPAAAVAAALFSEPPRLRAMRPDAPRDLDLVVRACLRKQPARRARSAAAVRDDLDRVLRGEAPAALPRWRPRAALAGLALLLAGGGAAAGLSAMRAAPPAQGSRANPGIPAQGITIGQREARAEALVARAREVRTADPRQAAGLVGDALAMFPGRHDWRVERGLFLCMAGEGIAACQEWESVPEGAPEAGLSRLYMGLEAIGRRQNIAALLPYLQTAARGPHREGLLAAAIASAWIRDFVQARRFLEGLQGWEVSVLRGLVEGMDPAGDPRVAARELDAVVAEGFRPAWVHNNRGVARGKLGDFAGAEADYTEAIRLKPDDADYRFNRGSSRDERGDSAGGLADLDEALRLRPGFVAALVHRCLARRTAGDLDGALRDGDEAIRLDPKIPEAWTARAHAKADAGDKAGAIADYEEVLRVHPGDPEAVMNLGVTRLQAGDPAGAERDLTASLALKPGWAKAHQARATARHQQGDVQGALADARAALASEPDMAEAHLSLALALEQLGQLREAEAAYERCLVIKPDLKIAGEIREWLAGVREKIARGR
ncbi:MAG: tetratricopeptide repeat protein [Planctomycetales bacterium]|nr:tetratricopeptide repeat protein [Planctomycetales bacterium]